MYLLYVDDSGDCGLANSPSRYYALSGLVIHERHWRACLDKLIAFRQRMRQSYSLRLREEIHAAHLITRPGSLRRIPRQNRLAILRAFAKEVGATPHFRVINVLVDKQGKSLSYHVFTSAWNAMIQRFENTLAAGNFPGAGGPNECGLLLSDHTDDKSLTLLLREMRRYNPIPNQAQHGVGYRNLSLTRIVEDPNFRDSEHSYFIQAADTCAYLLYQHIEPNAFMRRKAGQNYFHLLDDILCTVCSPRDPEGIVRL